MTSQTPDTPTERLLGTRDAAPLKRRTTPLKDRREARTARSQRRQRQHIEAKAAAASTPLDLYGVAYSTLRGRLVQLLRKAENAVARAEEAGDRKQLEQAQQRLAETQAAVGKVCSQVIAYLEKQADQIDTARR